jgi:sugar/nucleoside kinase (ribokinase family)
LPSGAVIHYVYSGAAKTMDSEEGKKLSRVMEELKKRGYITMVDPHTLSKNPQETISRGEIIEGYNLLKPVLPHLSWFFASEAEAMMIANTFGFFSKRGSQEDKNYAFLRQIAKHYCVGHSPRILGVTAGTIAYILFLSSEGNQVGPISVKSRYTVTDADKFIGAGDSFRAGFEAEWIKGRDYPEKFWTSDIAEEDLERLCHAGHLMAACYVTRTPSDQYWNIPKHRDMARIIDSGIAFSDKATLLSNLNIE